jgi:hypothetical protein
MHLVDVSINVQEMKPVPVPVPQTDLYTVAEFAKLEGVT